MPTLTVKLTCKEMSKRKILSYNYFIHVLNYCLKHPKHFLICQLCVL